MSTSAVNPMPILATPPTGAARSLSVSDGFVDTLNKAIRREDTPVARRERPQQSENEAPTKKSEESTEVADANVDQEASNTDAEATTTERVDEVSSERKPEDEQESPESTGDVVVISDQGAQQAAVVIPAIVPEGETSEQVDAEGASIPAVIPPVDASGSSAAASTPPEMTQPVPAALENETSVPVNSEAESEATVDAEAAQVVDPSKTAKKSGEAVVSTTKVHGKPVDSAENESEDGEAVANTLADGTTNPQEAAPVAAVQTTDSDTGRDSGSAKQQASSKVEPKSTPAEQPTAPEVEVEGLKLHTEGDATLAESKDRPATTTTNFSSVLDRAASLASRRSTPTEAPSQQMPQVDAQRFVNRVSRAFQVAENRGGPLQLRLSPPELGALKIELTIQQGTLTAKLETETAAAKSVLLDNLPALRERLAAQEIRIDKFEVDVRQQNSGEQPNWQAQQDGQDARHARAAGQGRRPTTQQTTDVPGAGQPTAARTHHDGQFSAVA